ncbi:MAG: cytidylate kinase-like family protein [Candidatus Latescibacterota bacterium]|nr:MAG: cytidylate kinase-like family protein [Candidatus Latescibacterota bacterium]
MTDLGKRFEKCQSYITSHVERAKFGGKEAAKPSITISRQTGAGAITLGDHLAAFLNHETGGEQTEWAVFDKNLVKQVLEDHDLPRRLEQYMPEDKPGAVGDAIADILGMHPPDWKLIEHTQSTIYRLAKIGHSILVGRGANIITRDLPNVLHLRLIDSIDRRIARCVSFYDISESQAREFIKKTDRGRRRYMLAYYDAEIDDPSTYDMVINVERFSTQALVQFIADMIPRWGQ